MHLDGIAATAALLLVFAFYAVQSGVSSFTTRRELIRRRLRGPGEAAGDAPAEPEGMVRTLAQGLAPLARIAGPMKEEERSRLRQRLVRAGLRREHATQLFLAAKVILGLALLLGFGWFEAGLSEPSPYALQLAVVLCAVGFYAPNVWLSSRIKERQAAIRRGLPDSLDLLVTCVEAGLGLDAALVRVAGETRLAFPVLAEELELTFLEVKAGLPRVEAFRRLAERTGVDDLKQLAATLAQTEMFGTSIGLALRVQAEGMRVRRMQRAEEQAGMVAVKMTLPLVFCILPSLFAVVIGPAIVNISETLLTNKPGGP